MIPRELHYVWLGQDKMHPLMVQWRKEWERLHPEWTVTVWSEDRDQRILRSGDRKVLSQNPQLLPRCCNLSQKSNAWRYDLVEQLGGVYLDADFEPVRPIGPLVEGLGAFAGTSWVEYPEGPRAEPACSLFGASAHHPWVQDLVRNLPSRDPGESRSMGFGYFSEVTNRHPEVRLFTPNFFYSQKWEDPAHYKRPVPPEAHAVHRWSSKWFEPSFRPITTGGRS